ncbi:hypothetical protein AMTR_s00020p00167870 [Amborella trichopoda]|uniref:Uncharacterized protein n=1 Tax=Amborella trichopoda TaxID=13333 RepID=W1PVX7_AMBTC|nr:hypothetical protein AMTR_s00020p00167870 [Amborella trichopoda]
MGDLGLLVPLPPARHTSEFLPPGHSSCKLLQEFPSLAHSLPEPKRRLPYAFDRTFSRQVTDDPRPLQPLLCTRAPSGFPVPFASTPSEDRTPHQNGPLRKPDEKPPVKTLIGTLAHPSFLCENLAFFSLSARHLTVKNDLG